MNGIILANSFLVGAVVLQEKLCEGKEDIILSLGDIRPISNTLNYKLICNYCYHLNIHYIHYKKNQACRGYLVVLYALIIG